jgi:hypothetical protein
MNSHNATYKNSRDFDVLLKHRLKNWANKQHPPRNGRRRLMETLRAADQQPQSWAQRIAASTILIFFNNAGPYERYWGKDAIFSSLYGNEVSVSMLQFLYGIRVRAT